MKVSPSDVVNATPKSQVEEIVRGITSPLRAVLIEMVSSFAGGPTPGNALKLEQALFSALLDTGRELIEQLFNSLEKSPAKQPATVRHGEQNYRRIEGETVREVVTRFGKIRLSRSRYRQGRRGKLIFPLELTLGLQQGFTPAAASLVGQQFAATGSTQAHCIEFIQRHLGSVIGVERLRKLSCHLASRMEPFRHGCQLKKLRGWLDKAEKSKSKSVVLAVSRDAVSLGTAPLGFFEMASVATISVLSNGQRLGTVYLARTPETNQQTLSRQLTGLLRQTLQGCSCRPHVVYVTDAGKVETAYWRQELSKFYVDGVRIKVHRVVDYYHASERLTVIADSLKWGKDRQARWDWLVRVRRLLLEPGGHGRVMRSISRMVQLHGIKSGQANLFKKAVNYLNNQKRYMNYFQAKSNDFPVGSGVVESACKQIVTERMKLSGMRWKRAGAQVAMTLRCILLSNIWDDVFDAMLDAIEPVSDVMQNQEPFFTESVCA